MDSEPHGLYGAGRKAKGRGGEAQQVLRRQALRMGKALKLEAPLPEDFEAVVARLRGCEPG